MRTGTGFRVSLKTERRAIGTCDALQGTVKQRTVGRDERVWQSVIIDGEAVVLTGNHDLLASQLLHRVVGAVMAEFHLDGTGATRQ